MCTKPITVNHWGLNFFVFIVIALLFCSPSADELRNYNYRPEKTYTQIYHESCFIIMIFAVMLKMHFYVSGGVFPFVEINSTRLSIFPWKHPFTVQRIPTNYSTFKFIQKLKTKLYPLPPSLSAHKSNIMES